MLQPKISLVIPVRDEAATIATLFEGIDRQVRPPDQIVIVDGGSRDGTPDRIRELSRGRQNVKLVTTVQATPGKGRNIGIEAAENAWIALTDAGISLEDDWLERLVAASSDVDYVQGNFAPVTTTFFTKCASMAYVPPAQNGKVRGQFIASSLVRKDAWKAVGGFPDLRAAEDLIFIENIRKSGFRFAEAPDAMARWELRPDISSTFRKFILYSKHNVWAGRQWDWHYGILRQYVLLLPVIAAALLHSGWWLVLLPLWLAARTAKRIAPHRQEFGTGWILNPAAFAFTAFLIIVLDLATFIGWFEAALKVKPGKTFEES